MFIASYIPLLTERDNSVDEGYKHRAPPEQGPSFLRLFVAMCGALLIFAPLMR